MDYCDLSFCGLTQFIKAELFLDAKLTLTIVN